MRSFESQDFKRAARDFLVGLGIFAAVAFFVLDGKVPENLPNGFTGALSIDANAAEYSARPTDPAAEKPVIAAKAAKPESGTAFKNTNGWTALTVMAIMFAMLYAFDLALLRRWAQSKSVVRVRKYPRH